MESEKPVIDFARVRTDRTCVIGVGWPAGARRGCHRPDPALRRSRPMTELHRRLRTINIAGSGAPQNGRGGTWECDRGSAAAIGPRTTGQGITASPRRTPLDNDNRLTSLAGWAREMAGSGRVSGAVAHLSKSRRAARRRDAIADRMLGMGDHRPAVRRGRTMAVGTFVVCSNAAVNSDFLVS